VSRPRSTNLADWRSRQHRRLQTVSEARVWRSIKAKRLGVRFRRQVPIGNWIVDFACLAPKLVIEIDDESHLYRDETERTAFIESQGFAILRFWNSEVATEYDGVIGTIQNWIAAPLDGRDPETW